RPPVLARQDQPDHRPHPPTGQIQGQRAQGRQAATHSQTGLRALSPLSGTAGPGAPDRLAMTRPSRHEVGVLPSHLFFSLQEPDVLLYTRLLSHVSKFPRPNYDPRFISGSNCFCLGGHPVACSSWLAPFLSCWHYSPACDWCSLA